MILVIGTHGVPDIPACFVWKCYMAYGCYVQCGGDRSAVKAADPVLRSMGKKVWHCGEAGLGQAAKVGMPCQLFAVPPCVTALALMDLQLTAV